MLALENNIFQCIQLFMRKEDIKKIVNDIINGSLTNVASYKTKYFKFQVP